MSFRNYAEEADRLKPFVLPWIESAVAAGDGSTSTGGGTLTQHALEGAYHTGTLAESQAPWAVTDSEFASHTSNANAHHARQHSLTSASDHTITGSAFDLLGATATNTLGILTPSSAPGAASAILKSDASGFLTLPKFVATTNVTTPLIDTASGDLALTPASGTVTVNSNLTAVTKLTAPLLDTASGDLALTPASGTVTVNSNLTAVATVQGVTLIGTTKVTTPLIDTASGNLSLTPASGTVVAYNNLVAITSVITPMVTNTGQLIVEAGATSLKLGMASTYPVQIDGQSLFINNGVPDGGAALHVKSATISDVTAHFQKISGQTTRIWKITDESGQELIILDEEGNLESGSPGFYSGLTGWQMTAAGDLEANSAWIRGELHSSIFVADEFHASSGTMVISSAGRLKESATVVAGSPVILDIEDPAVGHAQMFSVGERLRSKAIATLTGIGTSAAAWPRWPGLITHAETSNSGIHIVDIWLQVTAITDMGSYWRYTCELLDGSNCQLNKGVAVIRWGQVGEGLILLTSDLNYAPYIDVFTSGAQPWAGDISPHVRMGKLTGVGVLSSIHQWGIVAGSDLSDNTSPYFVGSNAGIELYRAGLILHDGINPKVSMTPSGLIKFGKDIDVVANTGFSFDPDTGDVVLGNLEGQYVRWNQASGIMDINGSLVAGEAPTAVSWTDISGRPADEDIYNNQVQWSDVGNIPDGFAGDYRDIVNVTFPTFTGTSATQFTIPAGTVVNFRGGDYPSKTLNARVVNLGGNGVMMWVLCKNGSLNDNGVYVATSPNYITNNDVLLGVARGGTKTFSFTPTWGRVFIGDNLISAGTIITSHIVSGAITTTTLAAGAVVASKITAGTITANEIAIGTITANRIATGTITADRMNVTSLEAMTVNTGDLAITGTLTAGGGDTLITPDGIAIARSGYLLEAPEENSIHWYADPSTKATPTAYIWNLYDVSSMNIFEMVAQADPYWGSKALMGAQNSAGILNAYVSADTENDTIGRVDIHQTGRGYVAGALTATGYCYLSMNGTLVKVLVAL